MFPVHIRRGINVTINIWDLGGDSRYKGLGYGYLVKADLCVIYDPTYNINVPNAFVHFAQKCTFHM